MRKIRINGDSALKLDAADIKLIKLLQEDGRLKDTDAAVKLGISNDTVKRRRERLEREGLIKIKAHIAIKRLGYTHYLHLAVSMKPSASTKRLAENLSGDPGVYYIALSMGPKQHVLVHYRARTREELYDFTGRVRKMPGVENVDVNVIFDVIKAAYHSVDLQENQARGRR